MQAPASQTVFVLILTILTLLSVLWVAMLLARRARATKVKTLADRTGFMQRSPKCPGCQLYMLHGFTYAPRGLFWREIEEKARGLFAPVGKSIENTKAKTAVQGEQMQMSAHLFNSCLLLSSGIDRRKAHNLNDCARTRSADFAKIRPPARPFHSPPT